MRYHDRALYLCVLRELSALKVFFKKKERENHFRITVKVQPKKMLC